ncbi:tRNA-Thr(GGU) m(6)t(6)A37 methyltransferase TsaA [Shimia isoporae]|uniref:tRNA-Thr(GGU) m(6)t(6)A37 methyltransferase TsaA n=1 Tax=Shimia isoporae TaxID=647720 RepID=A0A4R1N081_9RHOB|nr:TrmO family methyltransferase [Shimia isoporae]TCK98976.1 tRNA-Thr(GGU) m(6)t(6)A37 methyltransferase TsaA [Shimia isoporae]
MGEKTEIRHGEKQLDFDPLERVDAEIRFIGRIRTPWSRGNCPKNVTRARETGQGAIVELDLPFVEGLTGLEVGQGILLFYWMDQAHRDLITQRPRHHDSARGTFALRSPNRVNPISLAAVRITSLDQAAGRIGIDAIDCFDGTPLVDIKPSAPAVDVPPK